MAGSLRCPENRVPMRLPPAPHKSDTTNWEFPKTTTKESFGHLKKPKSIVTRLGRFEQFIWHEMYNEYLRAIERAKQVDSGPRISEYKDQFATTVSRQVEDMRKEELVNYISKYPVYGSEAISYWNPTGKQPNQFKTKYLISRSVHLQETQFG